jgi:hypothetical protein
MTTIPLGPIGPSPAVRAAAVRRGRLLNRLTIGWNAVEDIVAVAAGVAAESVSLVDSGIEVSAAVILAWRLAQERRQGCRCDTGYAVILIPPGATEPNQIALHRTSAQPDLARPSWTVENRRLAVRTPKQRRTQRRDSRLCIPDPPPNHIRRRRRSWSGGVETARRDDRSMPERPASARSSTLAT